MLLVKLRHHRRKILSMQNNDGATVVLRLDPRNHPPYKRNKPTVGFTVWGQAGSVGGLLRLSYEHSLFSMQQHLSLQTLFYRNTVWKRNLLSGYNQLVFQCMVSQKLCYYDYLYLSQEIIQEILERFQSGALSFHVPSFFNFPWYLHRV